MSESFTDWVKCPECGHEGDEIHIIMYPGNGEIEFVCFECKASHAEFTIFAEVIDGE